MLLNQCYLGRDLWFTSKICWSYVFLGYLMSIIQKTCILPVPPEEAGCTGSLELLTGHSMLDLNFCWAYCPFGDHGSDQDIPQRAKLNILWKRNWVPLGHCIIRWHNIWLYLRAIEFWWSLFDPETVIVFCCPFVLEEAPFGLNVW